MKVNNFYTQTLNIKDTTPVYRKNKRTPHSQKNRQIDNLIQNELIEPSVSSYNSPIILAPKKSQNKEPRKYRMCIDYRSVNKQLVPDKFPLPRIEDIQT